MAFLLMYRISDDGPITMRATGTGAVVRKPSGKEPAGGLSRCCRAHYGRPQMLGIGGNREHCLGGCLEQEIVDHRLVLIGDVADRRRQCEHDVEVWDGEQLRFPRCHPLTRRRALALWAMPVAAACMRPSKSSAYFKARSTFFLNFIAVSLFDLKVRFSAPTHMSREPARAGAVKVGRHSGAPRAQRFQATPGRPRARRQAGGGRHDDVEGSPLLQRRRPRAACLYSVDQRGP
jgi:hypothetical protein